MISGLELALTLILSVAGFYGWWSGMWRGHGGGFHGSLGPLALAFATAAGLLGLLDVAGLFTRSAFPPVPTINFVPLVYALVVYAALYIGFTRAPFSHHRFLTVALFDRLMDGKPVLRAYSQRRAGVALTGMLDRREKAVYR